MIFTPELNDKIGAVCAIATVSLLGMGMLVGFAAVSLSFMQAYF